MKITSKAHAFIYSAFIKPYVEDRTLFINFSPENRRRFKQQVILFFILSGNQKSFCLQEFFRIREHEKTSHDRLPLFINIVLRF